MDVAYNMNGAFIPTPKRNVDIGGADFYPTPKWATYALIENSDFSGDIWEPACGDGAMSKILEKTGNAVVSSDLYDRGYGEIGIDFLKEERRFPNIITNPPFNSAEGFVENCLKSYKNKFALLLRLAFFEGARRQKQIFNMTPPSQVLIFSERITFYPKGKEKKGSGTTAYAWFIWDKHNQDKTFVDWIPVGLKAKYGD